MKIFVRRWPFLQEEETWTSLWDLHDWVPLAPICEGETAQWLNELKQHLGLFFLTLIYWIHQENQFKRWVRCIYVSLWTLHGVAWLSNSSNSQMWCAKYIGLNLAWYAGLRTMTSWSWRRFTLSKLIQLVVPAGGYRFWTEWQFGICWFMCSASAYCCGLEL
jgi:hypothetical protein